MAAIGVLGDVVFQVSDAVVKTLSNVKWNSAAKYSEHERHLKDPKLEYTGMSADSITFDIHLSAFLGVDPMKEIVTLFRYERDGTTLPLTVGTKAYGKYRWVITDTKRTLTCFDNRGNLLAADVSLSLQAYTR